MCWQLTPVLTDEVIIIFCEILLHIRLLIVFTAAAAVLYKSAFLRCPSYVCYGLMTCFVYSRFSVSYSVSVLLLFMLDLLFHSYFMSGWFP